LKPLETVGLIVERTIALRPYPAVKLFRDAMYASLKDKLPPDVWASLPQVETRASEAADLRGETAGSPSRWLARGSDQY
jgi:hypothetical protein